MSGAVTVTAAAPSLYYPRIQALSGGKLLPPPASITVERSRLARGDTFTVLLPIEGNAPFWWDPADPTSTAAQADVDIALQLGFRTADQAEGSVSYQTVVQGAVSEVDADLDTGWVTIQGRDYSSRLVDHQMVGQAYLNQTIAQALTALAGQVGLTADVDATDGLVGQFYQHEHKATARATGHTYKTGWDFAVAMQRLTGYDLWVDGTTLHFKKPATGSSASLRLHYTRPTAATPYPSSHVKDLKLHRKMLLTKGIVVTVTSWDSKQKVSHSAQYPAKPAKDAVSHTFRAPSGTPKDTLQALAATRYNEVLAHSRTVTGLVHPAVVMTPRMLVALLGTGTTFDQTYGVDSVRLTVSAEQAQQSVTLRNRIHLDDEEQDAG